MGMADGIRRLPSGSYQARWTDKNGERQSFTGTFQECQSQLAKAGVAKGAGRGFDSGILKRPFNSFVDDFFASKGKRVAPRTYQSDRDIYRMVIKGGFGETPVNEINTWAS